MITLDKYEKEEKKQKIHRTLNTVLNISVFSLGVLYLQPVLERLTGLEEERKIEQEISQLASDEGYRSCIYSDSLGKATIGFGHLIKENTSSCIDGHEAVERLREDYEYARLSVERNYPWAEGEVKLVMINMTYQLGETGFSKFKDTISYLKQEEYDLAAGEMLNSVWAKQTPNRAGRLAGRIMSIGYAN